MKNQKGFAEVVLIGAIVGMTVLFLAVGPLKGLLGGGGSKKVKTEQSSYIEKPVFVKDPKTGEEHVLISKESYSSNFENNNESKTLIQKLLALPKLWVLLMILGFFFPPIAAVMAFINSKLKLAVRQMVSGIENGLASVKAVHPESEKKLLDSMSRKYDESTKLLVSKVKKKL